MQSTAVSLSNSSSPAVRINGPLPPTPILLCDSTLGAISCATLVSLSRSKSSHIIQGFLNLFWTCLKCHNVGREWSQVWSRIVWVLSGRPCPQRYGYPFSIPSLTTPTSHTVNGHARVQPSGNYYSLFLPRFPPTAVAGHSRSPLLLPLWCIGFLSIPRNCPSQSQRWFGFSID